jgi:hypothetical protein
MTHSVERRIQSMRCSPVTPTGDHMATQRLTVPEIVALQGKPDDPLWNLPAVAFMRDGSEVHLAGRSLRQANDEMLRDGDADVWWGSVNAAAVADLGVLLPEGQDPGSSQQVSADATWQKADEWATVYVAACGEVLTAANACLEAANRAVGARCKIAEHQNDGLPGTPIAIRNFARWAEQAEQEFLPLYRGFAEACTKARETAAGFLAAHPGPKPEIVLMMKVSGDVLDNVATVKAILQANYGPTPDAFIEGVQESNELMQNPPDEGNIYTPPAPAQSDERICPWCAETIKAAAVICRFCGRELQVQPDAN